ncbi:MAG: 8-amino-7-oxononanoate synthase [Leptospiraceae bacterium]|nr:8-amino-7-oxononanoate synthase [Leptospiraceae bacterium]MCP5498276.1 8-amino-7-oxononanoate synthase [Leptospiraceae bacterium]
MVEDYFQQELENIQSKNRYRRLKAPTGMDFSSNDYLCLSQHPEIMESLHRGIKLFGAGSTASRLIRGHRAIYEKTEENFSGWVSATSSLYVMNGYLANLGLLDCISHKDSEIFCDRLNHASILDGIRLSGTKVRYYRHLDMSHLEELLQKSEAKTKIIVSETVFSMDGDLADLQELLRLKQKHEAILILDEAHALGVFGNRGQGLANDKAFLSPDLLEKVDFRVYTCGKSMGLQGAFISCSRKEHKKFLINRMRPFIFSTAPMPAIAYAVNKSINLIKRSKEQRTKILENAEFFRQKLKEKGYNTLNSKSQIIPVILKDEEEALYKAGICQEEGFDVRAIRPPTVKQSRLRLSINAGIRIEDIKRLLGIL